MEKTLRRALDSLVNQSYRDYEVIMIDDGSKDGSGAICDEYAVKYPNFSVCHKQNGGLSSARNKGFELARGEWVTFCDSDDYVLPMWLSYFCVEHMDRYDLICQGVVTDIPINDRIYNIGKTEYAVEYSGEPVGLLDLLYKENILGYTYLKLYRRSIICGNDIKFDERLYLREDEEFLLRYINYCKSVFSTKNSGYYYFVPDWNRKYDIKFEIEEIRMQSSYMSLKKLMGSRQSKIYEDFMESIIDFYCRAFFDGRSIDRKYCLVRLREILRSAEISPKMFVLTKNVLKLDWTYCISKYILWSHLTFRSMLNNVVN